jgi:hypothetical protein
VLSAYKGEEGVGSELIDADASRGFFQTCGVALGQLYKYAWFGQPYWVYWDTAHYGVYWPDPVLEVHDTALFQYNYDNNRGFYNYSLLLPHEQATREELMARMQYDLVNCFGYTATIETRLMPYWRLTITEAGKKKLKSIQAKAEVLERGPSGLRAKGITIGDLLDNIRGYNKSPMAILDETGFTSAIDINLVAALIDINDMRSAFLKEGLVLEESRKPMQVLVVKDKGAILRLSNNK